MFKFIFVLILSLFTFLNTHSFVHATLECGSYSTTGVCTSDGDEVASFKFLETIFARFLNIAIGLISLAIIIMFVVGAYRILTSGGDPKGVQSGRDTIMWAVIGLVIAVSSYFIIQLVGNITGAEDITTFQIDTPVQE